jgi:hypothetical protein
MANYLVRDPFRTLMYERGDSREKVTLARVGSLDEGLHYKTVPFTQRRSLEGEHMVRQMLTRRQARGL